MIPILDPEEIDTKIDNIFFAHIPTSQTAEDALTRQILFNSINARFSHDTLCLVVK